MYCFLVFFTLVLAATSFQTDSDELYDDDHQNFYNLELEHYKESQSMMQAKRIMNEKCGSEENTNKAMTAISNLKTCLMGTFDAVDLQNQMEMRQGPSVGLKMVFKKYCPRRDTMVDCVKQFTVSIDPCLKAYDKYAVVHATKFLENLLDYACFNDGERIINFVVEGGVNCVSEKMEAMRNCANPMVVKYMSVESSYHEIDNEVCEDLTGVRDCVVDKLKQCTENTPYTLVGDVFNLYLNEIQCNHTMSTTEYQL